MHEPLMLLSTMSTNLSSGGQIAIAAFLALAGFFLLLPRPRKLSGWGGIAAVIASIVVFCVWLQTTYGNPMPDVIGTILFWLFSVCALVFGSVLVIQHNPARGAIAFAFVILSTCGLFLLLAATFLMAATIIIYAGAIIVTFLFVLMLSQPRGLSDENDRSREPLFGALAGFAFTGLVLFALYLTALGKGEVSGVEPTASQRLPAPELTKQEREKLREIVAELDGVNEQLSGDLTKDTNRRSNYFEHLRDQLVEVVGLSRLSPIGTEPHQSIRRRFESMPGRPGKGGEFYREDQQTRAVIKLVDQISNDNWIAFRNAELLLTDKKGDPAAVKAQFHNLRDEVVLLSGSVDLPQRNVENLGFLLYADHLLSIELAGTLLLIATIGAIAIAHRKGVTE